jgi:hypothetical protein
VSDLDVMEGGAKIEKTIKPIETKYNGFRFRNRLEARWAIFFDMISLKSKLSH